MAGTSTAAAAAAPEQPEALAMLRRLVTQMQRMEEKVKHNEREAAFIAGSLKAVVSKMGIIPRELNATRAEKAAVDDELRGCLGEFSKHVAIARPNLRAEIDGLSAPLDDSADDRSVDDWVVSCEEPVEEEEGGKSRASRHRRAATDSTSFKQYGLLVEASPTVWNQLLTLLCAQDASGIGSGGGWRLPSPVTSLHVASPRFRTSSCTYTLISTVLSSLPTQ